MLTSMVLPMYSAGGFSVGVGAVVSADGVVAVVAARESVDADELVAAVDVLVLAPELLPAVEVPKPKDRVEPASSFLLSLAEAGLAPKEKPPDGAAAADDELVVEAAGAVEDVAPKEKPDVGFASEAVELVLASAGAAAAVVAVPKLNPVVDGPGLLSAAALVLGDLEAVNANAEPLPPLLEASVDPAAGLLPNENPDVLGLASAAGAVVVAAPNAKPDDAGALAGLASPKEKPPLAGLASLDADEDVTGVLNEKPPGLAPEDAAAGAAAEPKLKPPPGAEAEEDVDAPGAAVEPKEKPPPPVLGAVEADEPKEKVEPEAPDAPADGAEAPKLNAILRPTRRSFIWQNPIQKRMRGRGKAAPFATTLVPRFRCIIRDFRSE